MRLFLTFISTVFILASCQTKNNSQPEKFQVLLPDTAKTHYPNKFAYLVDRGKQLHLPKLDTGVNGTKIRLWIESMAIPHTLVTLNIGQRCYC